ncbi:hypothetical protein J4E83_008884 [Alternaria metachromatica]|uniref:uncharacterized protein n=1 Tax=Alternaria metachromatica TaxID=283354 RepID=UPI0020C59E05|nr:uncharacterized protein J4E83_008884 [Alternaria metachromatica]KAI4608845.1 hypothetical protein J4E83_008884 [Alternaria metachromatica]
MSGSEDSGIALSMSHERNTPNVDSASEEATATLPREPDSSKSDPVPTNITEVSALPVPEIRATGSRPPSIEPGTDRAGSQMDASDASEPEIDEESGTDPDSETDMWVRRREVMKSRIKLAPRRVKQVNQYNKILEERLTLLEEGTELFEKKLRRLLGGEEISRPPSPEVKAKRQLLEPELKFHLSKGLKHDSETRRVHQIDVFVGEPEAQKSDRFLRRKKQSKSLEDNDMDDGRIASDPILERSSASNDERRLAEEMVKVKNKHFPSLILIEERSITHLFRKFLTGDGTDTDIMMLRPFKPLLQNREEILNIMSEVVTALTRIVDRRAEKDAGPASCVIDLDESAEAVQPNEAIQVTDDAHDKALEETGEKAGDNAVTEEASAPDAISEEEWDTVLKELELYDVANGCEGEYMDGWPTLSEVEKSFKSIRDLFDNYLLPGHMEFRERKAKKVRFCDLWHLFHTGDLVVTKRSTNLDGTETKGRLGMRVLMTAGGRRVIMPKLPAPVFQSPVHLLTSTDKIEPINGTNPFCIYTYYLDFNGSRLVPVRRRIVIAPYHGERNVSDLDVIPMEYAAGVADMLKERGKRFVETVSASIAPYVDCKGLELVTREELNDKVIVDMKGYFGTNPSDIPSFLEPEELDLSETSDCRQGKECSYSCVSCYHRSPVVHDQTTDLETYQEYVNEKPVFNPLSGASSAGLVDPSDFSICHYRVFAYKLRSREWVQVNVQDLQALPESEKGGGFDKLVLSDDHKSILESQVREHFRKRVSQATTGSMENDMDLVRGKGQGLIILLHGAPGVGKTCTAECIADLMEKPLYPITCGDLGSTAEDVEKNLKKHFTLASRWDCVMLLDEADVFLARRKMEDLQRNSIVSVFLRMLEYYKGLLFLTTNRVGTFDEAFTSRVHISLFYPDFDKKTTLAVWQTFINQTVHVLKSSGRSHVTINGDEIIKFAKKHWKDSKDSKRARWNGRQIRNAFHTAVAMAEFRARTQKGGAGYDNGKDVEISVGRVEFEKIASTAREFDTYMTETMGSTYEAKADREGLRKEQKKEEEKVRKNKKKNKQSKSKKESDSDSSESESEDDDDAKKKKKKKKPSKSKKRSDSSSGGESEDDDDSDSD